MQTYLHLPRTVLPNLSFKITSIMLKKEEWQASELAGRLKLPFKLARPAYTRYWFYAGLVTSVQERASS